MSQKNSRSEREPKSNLDKQKNQLKKAGFLDGGSDEAEGSKKFLWKFFERSGEVLLVCKRTAESGANVTRRMTAAS